MKRSAGQIWKLIWHKALADLMAESARAMLGIMWWVAEPILYMAVFYFVFSVGFRMGGPGFVPFLLAGLVTWKWFQGTISVSTTALIANQGLMSQVYLPKWSLVGMVVLTNSFKFAFVLLLFLIYLVAAGHGPTLNWLYAIPLLAGLFVLICGLAALSAFITCFVTEFKLVVDNGLMLMFFVSGIFFDINDREPAVRDTLLLNPLAGWIMSFRGVMLDQQSPDWTNLMWIVALGIVLLIISIGLLRRFDRLIAKVAI